MPLCEFRSTDSGEYPKSAPGEQAGPAVRLRLRTQRDAVSAFGLMANDLATERKGAFDPGRKFVAWRTILRLTHRFLRYLWTSPVVETYSFAGKFETHHFIKIGCPTREMESGGFENSSLQGMAENLDFPAARMDETPACQPFAKSLEHSFDHQAHGGHKAHGLARVRNKAAIGGGRKASLYAAVGMCRAIVHEPDGVGPSIRHHRKSSTGILANSTSNVEEPKNHSLRESPGEIGSRSFRSLVQLWAKEVVG